MMRPFNGSMFQLNTKYQEVFSNLVSSEEEQTEKINKPKKRKVYKIKYTLNLLPTTTFKDGTCNRLNDLMDKFAETEELEIFNSKVVKDFYAYQWEGYGKVVHLIGATLHLLYFILILVYTHDVYLYRRYDMRVLLIYLMFACLIYPLGYTATKLKAKGLKEYCSQQKNMIDLSYVIIGIVNLVIQRRQPDILKLYSQLMMIFVVITILFKSLFFLRIF